MQDLTHAGLSLGMWPAGRACSSWVMAVILGVIWACDTCSPSSMLWCCRSGSWPPLTVGLTLTSLSDSKMNCQSNAPPMKALITVHSTYTFQEPIQDLLLAMVVSHCLKTCLSPMWRLDDWVGTLEMGPWLFWIARTVPWNLGAALIKRHPNGP